MNHHCTKCGGLITPYELASLPQVVIVSGLCPYCYQLALIDHYCIFCGEPTTAKACQQCVAKLALLKDEDISVPVPESETNPRYETQWFYPSSSGKQQYKVSRKGDIYQCSCPVWTFRRKECKHILNVKLTQGAGAPPSVTPPPETPKRRRFNFDA